MVSLPCLATIELTSSGFLLAPSIASERVVRATSATIGLNGPFRSAALISAVPRPTAWADRTDLSGRENSSPTSEHIFHQLSSCLPPLIPLHFFRLKRG